MQKDTSHKESFQLRRVVLTREAGLVLEMHRPETEKT